MLYTIDDKPPLGTSLLLGFQHYLTMFGSTVAIPLLLQSHLGASNAELAILISTMFLVSGICTFLQSTFGCRLPIIQGGTFSFLGPAIAICGMASLADAGFEMRMQHVQGAVIAGSFFEMIIGFSGLMGKVLKFITPVTIAPTIALIGLALFKFGAPLAGQHWGIGGLTILLLILFSQYLRSAHRLINLFPILLGLLIAWAVATLCTWTGLFEKGHPAYVSFETVKDAPWIHVPTPFQWGMPAFRVAAIVGMLAGYIASMIESTGDYYAAARMSHAPPPDAKTVNRGIGFEGIGCFIAGIFGTGNGTTSYSENIGAIGLTRVGSRRVIQAASLLMLVLAVFGKFGALFTSIPSPIVGGMYCVMFAMVTGVGLSNLQFVDLNSPRNLFIIGFALFAGLSLPEYVGPNTELIQGLFPSSFQWFAAILSTIGSSGMAVGAFLALLLDNTIPGTSAERGIDALSHNPKTP
ncbi:solute carrier family 23 protein [Roseibacillus persicicus]|uniref:uracil-xanthine permease family protein n=1 Tax=Roseibacillus persicicus TaxID=454148 RepID=UPI00398AD42E